MQNFKYSEFARVFPGDIFEVKTSQAKRNNRSEFYNLEEALANAIPDNHCIEISIANPIMQSHEFKGCPVKDILNHMDYSSFRYYIFTEDKTKLFNIYMGYFEGGGCVGIDLDILTQAVDFDKLFGGNYYYLPEWDTTVLSKRIFDCYDYDQLLNYKAYGVSVQPSLWIRDKDTHIYQEFRPYVSYSNMILRQK